MATWSIVTKSHVQQSIVAKCSIVVVFQDFRCLMDFKDLSITIVVEPYGYKYFRGSIWGVICGRAGPFSESICNHRARCSTGWCFGCHFLFSHILGRIIPIDFHILQRGGPTTNQLASDSDDSERAQFKSNS